MSDIELRQFPHSTFAVALSNAFGFRDQDGRALVASEYYHVDENKISVRELTELVCKFREYKLKVMSDIVCCIIDFWKRMYDMGDVAVETALEATKGFDRFYDFEGICSHLSNSGPLRYRRLVWENALLNTRFDVALEPEDYIRMAFLDIKVPCVDSYDGEEETEEYSIPLNWVDPRQKLEDDKAFQELYNGQKTHHEYGRLFRGKDRSTEKKVLEILAAHPNVLKEIEAVIEAHSSKE